MPILYIEKMLITRPCAKKIGVEQKKFIKKISDMTEKIPSYHLFLMLIIPYAALTASISIYIIIELRSISICEQSVSIHAS